MTRGWQWPVGIVGILAATVALNMWVIWRAGSDPTFSIESDYYAKAVSWDVRQAQARRGQRLGWTTTPELSAVTATGATLTLRVTGADGLPLAGGRARVTARHVAYANQPVSAAFRDAGDGRLVAALPLTHAGLYDLELEVVRGTDRLVETLRVESGRLP